MIKLLTLLAFLTVGTSAFAGRGDYDCSGTDLSGQHVRVQINNEKPRSAFRTVLLTIGRGHPITYQHVDAYGGDEGYDLGVNTPHFSVWIHKAPNMLGTGQTAASYFEGSQQDLNRRAILVCK